MHQKYLKRIGSNINWIKKHSEHDKGHGKTYYAMLESKLEDIVMESEQAKQNLINADIPVSVEKYKKRPPRRVKIGHINFEVY